MVERSPVGDIGVGRRRSGLGDDSEHGHVQLVTATIDGVTWYADAPVLVTRRSGILGVAGFDGEGVGIAVALGAGRVGELQHIGRSAANAVVTIGDGSWVANAERGGGNFVLLHLTIDRAIGEFSFTAVPPDGGCRTSAVRVTGGRFDVRL